MRLVWTESAHADLLRLYDFLAAVNPRVAGDVVRALVRAPAALRANPRVGAQLFQFAPREVRRLIVRRYELRYELTGDRIVVLRVWHTREDR